MKQKALEYKGGVCHGCGYSACPNAMVFHHLDPSKKEFNFGGSTNRSWASMKTELDKCVLLCANCHAEVHAGMRSVLRVELAGDSTGSTCRI
jgi:hypothetical protein